MIRFILTKHVQDGIESDAAIYKTVDIDLLWLERTLSREGWRVAGAEIIPTPTPEPEPQP